MQVRLSYTQSTDHAERLSNFLGSAHAGHVALTWQRMREGDRTGASDEASEAAARTECEVKECDRKMMKCSRLALRKRLVAGPGVLARPCQ